MDRPPPPRPALILHVGAWSIPAGEIEGHRDAVDQAARRAWRSLADGAAAADVATEALGLLENDERLNAGTGATLNRDGHCELDVGLMRGGDMAVGAAAGLRKIKNPSILARRLLDVRHVLLHGTGAEAWAVDNGLELCDPEELVVQRERDRLEDWWREKLPDDDPGTAFGPPDTVGVVVIDREGHMAAGASTGGMCGKRPGRIGDSPIPGAGYYADDLVGAAAATGWGEPILRLGLSRRAVEFMRNQNAPDAAWLTMQELNDRVVGKGGVILIGRDGSIGFAFNTPHMPVAYMDEELTQPQIGGLPQRT